MTGEKITMGIVGAGGVVEGYHLPILHRNSNLRIAWICDNDLEKAKNLVKDFNLCAECFADFDTCPDVDVCLIAIPVGYRSTIVEKAIERGIHMLIEKPFATTLAEHQRWTSMARNKNLRIGCGLMRRYYKSTMLVKEILDSNLLGKLLKVEAAQGARMRGTGRAEWYQGNVEAAGGGVLIETGSHLVDQVFFITKAQKFDIQSIRAKIIDNLENDIEIESSLVLCGDEKVSLNLGVSKLRDLYCGIEFYFDNCILRLGLTTEGPVELCNLEGQVVSSLSSTKGASTTYQAFFMEWEDFFDGLKESNFMLRPYHAETSFLITDFIDQCYKKIRNDEIIRVI